MHKQRLKNKLKTKHCKIKPPFFCPVSIKNSTHSFFFLRVKNEITHTCNMEGEMD